MGVEQLKKREKKEKESEGGRYQDVRKIRHRGRLVVPWLASGGYGVVIRFGEYSNGKRSDQQREKLKRTLSMEP